MTPNFGAEWLAILLRIREVPGSDLGPENLFPQYLETNAEKVP
jgi:hypothetical protein